MMKPTKKKLIPVFLWTFGGDMDKKLKKLAKKAGFIFWENDDSWAGDRFDEIDWSCEYDEELEKFADLVSREKCSTMNQQIQKQIEVLEQEQFRVKTLINENGFDCTTAPYIIMKRYRDELKSHIKILKMNLDEQR